MTRLRILTWNIGFGALGAEADFAPDGGRSYLPSNTRLIRRNLSAIGRELATADADIVLLQEVALGGILARGVNSLAAVTEGLGAYQVHFQSDIATGWPLPARFAPHGMAVLSRLDGGRTTVRDLQITPSHFVSRVRKLHPALEYRVRIRDREWAFAGVHLPPYSDDPKVKWTAFEKLVSYAQTTLATGTPLVIGGDFNMLLQDMEVPHTVPQERLRWAAPLPRHLVPEGWQVISPAGVPTNRTLERPLETGQNYLSALDGFLCAPEVRVAEARTLDLKFRNADHNPVVVDIEV